VAAPAGFENVGADFRAYCPGKTTVTVLQIDPDTGATLATSAGVTALKRVTRTTSPGAGGGEVGVEECKFLLDAAAVSFTPRSRDKITDADGVTWSVGDVETIGFGQLHSCSGCVRVRGE